MLKPEQLRQIEGILGMKIDNDLDFILSILTDLSVRGGFLILR
jgi:hypothetical protein